MERGRFAATMVVTLENDGPVTIVLDPDAQRSGPSPKGLPSESRQMAHRSPGWMTAPPSVHDPVEGRGQSSTEK